MALDITRLSIRHRGGAALFDPLTLHVAPGTIATVMGPSGIGKSTLLDAIGGHLAPDFALAGEVWLNGKDICRLRPEDRHIGLIFQDALLFPHLSVADNLAFGLPQHLRGRTARRAAVAAALEKAGLAGLGDRDPATLSGGQKARAALMRTLLSEPAALLLDEPFSKLDDDLRTEIRRFTFDHIRARDIPALLVTHDRGDAESAGGTVVGLGQGNPA
ncbi:MAG: ATP-binding cassette domain-containing protein [Defluviimonas denitrificans]